MTLVIRNEQMRALGAAMQRRFEDSMVAYLTAAFPEKTEPLGEQGVRALVADGIAKGATYDIRAERNLARLIELMIVMGRDFDTSEEFAWTRTILDHPRAPEGGKLDLLRDMMPTKAPHVRLPA